MEEWSELKKWNPFNSYKLLAQTYRWERIKRASSYIPQPALVTIDPINICDLNCSWCNSEAILNNRRGMIHLNHLNKIADSLAAWKPIINWNNRGVEAICIAGGGEPLLHPNLSDFIKKCLTLNIEVGVVTNGTHIEDHMDALSECTWVGVSVDAATSDTFKKIKGKDKFLHVISNMKKLIDFSKKTNSTLSYAYPGYGVTYKYLLHPTNISEMYEAVRIAKDIGCKNFHMRPAGNPYHRLKEPNTINFTDSDILILEDIAKKARKLESEDFGVYSVTHKFDKYLRRKCLFSKCWAIFMTAVFTPPRGNSKHECENFSIGFCVDRRGDSSLEIPEEIYSMQQVLDFWGSDRHWKMHDKINLEECPRCTCQPHNQIYENVILRDSMTYKFI